jgi:hypothetical protein
MFFFIYIIERYIYYPFKKIIITLETLFSSYSDSCQCIFFYKLLRKNTNSKSIVIGRMIINLKLVEKIMTNIDHPCYYIDIASR